MKAIINGNPWILIGCTPRIWKYKKDAVKYARSVVRRINASINGKG